MMEKAIEAFGKIKDDSQLKSDSMAWLENPDQGTDKTLTIETLPDFCSTVFVSTGSTNNR
jgi:hypothetical protein